MREVGNVALLPFTTRFRGPTYPPSNPEELGPYSPFFRLLTVDIIEECLLLFRGNCFFRNFRIKGSADRTLIYGILFISGCLNKLASRPSENQEEATKTLINLALGDFSIPGEPRFPLNSLYEPPANQQDAGIALGFGSG